MNDQSPKKKEQKKPSDSLGNYAKYSSIVFQMIIVLVGGILGGRYLDRILHTGFPYITLVFSLLSVALAIYIAVKDFLRSK